MRKLLLRGISFNPAVVSSGALNFYGDGWLYHRLYKSIFGKRFNFADATFIAKTTTILPREGNMALDDNFMPTEMFPDCIKVYLWKRLVLNAVGLSGPGASELFERGKWQIRTKPFMISFMSLGETIEEQVNEAEQFVELVLLHLKDFSTKFGVQVNGSCPNTGKKTGDIFSNSLAILEPFKRLQRVGIPIDYKISIVDALVSGMSSIKEIEASGLADCLTCSNTAKWLAIPDLIDWQGLFGTDISPLAKYGGGGLSGPPLKPLVENWVKEVRAAGVRMPIKAGGGVLGPMDAIDFLRAGASAVELGAISILAPYNVAATINAINNYRES